MPPGIDWELKGVDKAVEVLANSRKWKRETDAERERHIDVINRHGETAFTRHIARRTLQMAAQLCAIYAVVAGVVYLRSDSPGSVWSGWWVVLGVGLLAGWLWGTWGAETARSRYRSLVDGRNR